MTQTAGPSAAGNPFQKAKRQSLFKGFGLMQETGTDIMITPVQEDELVDSQKSDSVSPSANERAATKSFQKDQTEMMD